MNRKAKYTIDNSFRIISTANGAWRLQQRGNELPSREFDPWFNVGPPLDHETALAELRAREPFKRRLAA